MRDEDVRLWLRLFAVILFSFTLAPAALVGEQTSPKNCTYTTWVWNVRSRSSVSHREVVKPYSGLMEEEIDRGTGCTVCREDQEEIRLPGVEPFRMCRKLAASVRDALAKLQSDGEPLAEIVGYRVGRSSGDLDENGNRTKFSRHSYGIALDVNPRQNGLYDHCPKFGTKCRLRRGGMWKPGTKGAITADGAVVKALKAMGLQWGGEIAGQQKDFMHFSPDGY